jgi:hypothetical protein
MGGTPDTPQKNSRWSDPKVHPGDSMNIIAETQDLNASHCATVDISMALATPSQSPKIIAEHRSPFKCATMAGCGQEIAIQLHCQFCLKRHPIIDNNWSLLSFVHLLSG